MQNYRESLAEISFLLAASGVPTNQSTTGVEKCISVQTLLIASLFFEHAVKVKAVMHGPEFAKNKMQQRQTVVGNNTASWLAASPANSSSTSWRI